MFCPKTLSVDCQNWHVEEIFTLLHSCHPPFRYYTRSTSTRIFRQQRTSLATRILEYVRMRKYIPKMTSHPALKWSSRIGIGICGGCVRWDKVELTLPAVNNNALAGSRFESASPKGNRYRKLSRVVSYGSCRLHKKQIVSVQKYLFKQLPAFIG